MNDDPMKARAQRQIKAWKFKGDCLTREYAVVTAEMLSDFATKERSDALKMPKRDGVMEKRMDVNDDPITAALRAGRRSGMEAAAGICAKRRLADGEELSLLKDSPIWKVLYDVEQAIRAQIAEEAENG